MVIQMLVFHGFPPCFHRFFMFLSPQTLQKIHTSTLPFGEDEFPLKTC